MIVLLGSCSQHQEVETRINLASNRTMGVGIKSLKLNGAPVSSDYSKFILSLIEKSLNETYGSKVVTIPLVPGPLEAVDNIFEIGKAQIDDFFMIEGQITGGFDTTGTTPSLESAENTDDAIDLDLTIYNGANLKTVSTFKIRIPTKPRDQLETKFKETFRDTSLRAFNNPNIYPKNDPQYFANLVFVFAEQREKGMEGAITCENAVDRLKYYHWAKELYDIAIARGLNRAFGTQSEAHQMTTRQEDAEAKAKTLHECEEDAKRTFAINYEFGSISSEHQKVIRDLFDSSQLDALLKQYTNKPVTLRFQVEDGKLNLFMELRYDQKKYRAWTYQRIPNRVGAFQVLSLDPYYALMQKLVILRSSLPADAPASLKSTFEAMKMSLVLKTLLGGEVTFAAEGKFLKDQKTVSLGYPNQLVINTPGLGSKLINNKDPNIFQERGWIALGNCKTIEGTKTEDGLVYDFFGLPCQ